MNFHYIRFFDEVGINDVGSVGGKNASLAQMYQHLSAEGVKVPFGFATTSEAFRLFTDMAGITETIQQTLSTLNPDDVIKLSATGAKLRHLILQADFPPILEGEIRQAYASLKTFYECEELDVAIRSSATAEDLPEASFAGQQESYLNISGEEAVLDHIRQCYASLFTDRAISYRHSHGFADKQVFLCVGVQKMIRSDKASSGVMFSIDPDTGSDRLVVINSIWGLGENIVGGKVNPDEFTVFKPTLEQGYNPILKRSVGEKQFTMIYDPDDLSKTINLPTSDELQATYSITNEEVILLAHNALIIEKHFSDIAKKYQPMDIEWAKDGLDGELYIVQARPETVVSQLSQSNCLQRYSLKPDQSPAILLKGSAVGNKIASGTVRHIKDKTQFHLFDRGEVLVTDITDPDWEPIMKKASAVVTNRGGRTCHAAIVAREIGIPAVVGTSNATTALRHGQTVTVDCAEGDSGYVYDGRLEFNVETLDISDLHDTKTKLYLNVADPSKAFQFASLPNHGVGLARMEFIINNTIKVHPLALIDIDKGKKLAIDAEIKALMGEFSDPKEFFIRKLAEGVGTIAAAFYPKPVIVRTSDFKSNEYKHMLGGDAYEHDEENPMIGYRGTARYISSKYKEAFGWECETFKLLRDEMGLTNIKIMLPFVRTPEEGKKAISIMNGYGLIQGKNDLEIYAMCEIPSNVVLADRFLEHFDGYSIGSNDLTQLTLGVDRDSELIAHIFDERNEAVTRMIKMAIDACKQSNKYIGICGQAPSDYPEITEFLVKNGIDSISLNPDSVVRTWQMINAMENDAHHNI